MSNYIYKNDVGTIILIDMHTDISSATNLSLIVKKPNGDSVTWTPTIQSTSYLRYDVVSGDLNQVGKYSIQPSLTIGSWVGYGEIVYFKVNKKL